MSWLLIGYKFSISFFGRIYFSVDIDVLQPHECHVKVEALQKIETTVNFLEYSHLHTS